MSTAAQLHDFFRAEHRENKPYSAERRMALVAQNLGRSRREVERDLIVLSPSNGSLQRNAERQRAISSTETAVTLILSAAQLAKLARFRQCTSHRNGAAKLAALIEHAVDLALERVDPRERGRRASVVGEAALPEKFASPENAASPEKLPTPDHLASPAKPAPRPFPNRYVAASARRQLHARAHNQLHAIHAYGRKKMAPYLVRR